DLPANDQAAGDNVPEDDIYATIVDPESVELDQTMESDEQGQWAGMQTINENPEERSEDRNDQTLILDEPVENSDIGATYVEDGNSRSDIDATLVSDDVPPELMATMNSAWGDDMATMADRPDMTIKAPDL